jgi:hypothetical protein
MLLSGCDAMRCGRNVPTFQKNLLPSSLEFNPEDGFQTVGKFLPVTHHHIPGDSICYTCQHENLKYFDV